MKYIFIILLLSPQLLFAQTSDDYRKKAEVAFGEDDVDQALAYITLAIKQSPNNCAYYGLRSIYKLSTKKSVPNRTLIVSSLEDMNTAINLGCVESYDYSQRAEIYNKLGMKDKAIEDYQKALILLKDTTDYYTFYARGLIREQLEDYNGAIQDYSKAINLGNDCSLCIGIYGMRAHCKAKIRDYKGAIEDYTKRLQLDSTPNLLTGETYCNRGIVKMNSGDMTGACEDLRKASELGYMKAFELIRSDCSSIK